MTQDFEDISLKILRILYQFHEQNPFSELDEELIINKFDFLIPENGSEKIKKSLSELVKLMLINISEKDKKTYYTISKKGIIHYENFKLLSNKKSEPCYSVLVQGNWSGNNDNYHYHYHLNSSSKELFPGKTNEFILHYEELLNEIEEAKNLIADSHSKERVLEKLENMKTIINIDSSSIGQKLKWEERLENIINILETKAKELVNN